MDFDLSPLEQEYQQQVREFIRDNMTPEVRWDLSYAGLIDTPERRAFISKMADKGWLKLGFPESYGGDGVPNPMAKFILNMELMLANCPIVGKGLGQICGTLLLYGSEELKREFIPRTLRNEIQWAIAYSEPGAGSDLAALRASAVPDGDDFIINGEKRWITSAHFADYFWLAVRTDSSGPKHKGISLFIVDTKSPGVTIEPIHMVFKGHRTNTVYFDNVRVPRSRLVGDLDQGWKELMNALNLERFLMAASFPAVGRYRILLEWVKTAEVNGKPLLEDPVARHKLAKVDVLIEMARLLEMRCIARYAADSTTTPAAEATMNKAMAAIAYSELVDTALDLMGPDGYVMGSDAPMNGETPLNYLESGHMKVAAAGLDVARNMIAKQHLHLPSK
ncbi:MAG: acyl-CoA dehydrogenase [Gammaproteobacteria bacterium]|nr:MAG: acyl-CoA dehydrogenase [Gammaproteobacteria bacterium]